MKQVYLIRLDDACPTMDLGKWERMEDILDSFCISPLVGVIPHNEDPKQQIDPVNYYFWDKVNGWQDKRWGIALHGYNHLYITNEGLGGLNPIWRKSEFSGLPLEEQKKKIRKGVKVFDSHGVLPRYFFAPSHTFDNNTLSALETESSIRIISDTVAFRPYKYKGFIFVPQIFGHCLRVPFTGVFTFCFHPNTMKNRDFEKLECFLRRNKDSFIKWDELDLDNVREKKMVDKLLSKTYFTYRRLRGLR